jgi:hypothetical protein
LVDEAAARLPNLRVVYVSSRTSAYVLYPDDGPGLNSEPFAFESGFSVKWLVEDRMGAAGPFVDWGPYIWAHAGCNDDGFCWCCDDVRSAPEDNPDFTHPSTLGQEEVARALVRHFTTHPTAMPWFLAEPPPVRDACDGTGESTGGEGSGGGGGSSGGGEEAGATGTGAVDDGGGASSAEADSGGASTGSGASDDGDGGCGCRANGPGSAWWLAPVIAIARRSRRARR